jgi:hypothetical protein
VTIVRRAVTDGKPDSHVVRPVRVISKAGRDGTPFGVPRAGTAAATLRHMSDARQSPIPQDRVNENIDHAGRAKASTEQQRQQQRWLEDQGVDERPGTNPEEQPGIPNEPGGLADGGD